MKTGENNPSSLLSKREVARIREFHNRGKSNKWIAEEFEVTESTISKILNGKTWRPVPSADFKELPATLRTLQVLEQLPADKSIRKLEIAEIVNCSVGFIGNTLADLGKAGLVFQSKGYYRITGKGSRLLREDPTMIRFELEAATNLPSRFSISIDLSHFKHDAICKWVLNEVTDLELRHAKLFLPFVLLYMRTVGDKMPPLKFEEPMRYDHKLFETIHSILETLSQIEQSPTT